MLTIREDVTQFRGHCSEIPRLKDEISELRAQLRLSPADRYGTRNLMLERFLDESTVYAESILNPDDDDESTPGPSPEQPSRISNVSPSLAPSMVPKTLTKATGAVPQALLTPALPDQRESRMNVSKDLPEPPITSNKGASSTGQPEILKGAALEAAKVAALHARNRQNSKRQRELDEELSQQVWNYWKHSESNDILSIQELLQRGARVTGEPGRRPLVIACSCNHAGALPLIELLLDWGVDVHANDGFQSLLTVALHHYQYSKTKLLLERGANARSVWYWLGFLLTDGQVTEILQLLKAYGAKYETSYYRTETGYVIKDVKIFNLIAIRSKASS